MAIADTVSTPTLGFLVRVNNNDIDGVDSIDTFGGQTRSEVDVSNLSSTQREYITALGDPGVSSFTVVAAPYSPGMVALKEANDNNTAVPVLCAIGGKAADSDRFTDGSAREIMPSRTVAFSVVSTALTMTIAKSTGVLPGIVAGMFVDAGGTDQYKITNVTETSNNVVITTDGTTAITKTTAKIVAPGVKWEANAFVQELNYSAATDDAVRASVSLRATGRWTQTIGNPDASL